MKKKIIHGNIKKLIQSHQYGFITAEEEGFNNLFFHRDFLKNLSFDMLRIGDYVAFELGYDEKGRKAALNIHISKDKSLVPYKEINFGYSSAEDESANCPELLLNGFFDFNGFSKELINGSHFVVLGYKGSGKSALAEHIRLISISDPTLFVKNIFLSDFPFVNFAKIINTDDLPASKYPTAWSWILLLYLIASFDSDVAGTSSDVNVFNKAISSLKKAGLLPSPDLKQLINISTKTSFKGSLPKFFEVGREYSGYSMEDAIPFFVEKLKSICMSFQTDNKHFLIIDGLDDILTYSELQYDALASLLLETSRLNSEFMRDNLSAKVILLCRTDLFEKIPGPNKNKIRQDSALFLDWYEKTQDPARIKLLELSDQRAKLYDKRIGSVIADYFPAYYKSTNIHKSLLSFTRFIPRDYLQLLKSIQKIENSIRISKESVSLGINDYSCNYFMPEIKDALIGFLPPDEIELLFSFLGSVRKRSFEVKNFLNTVSNNQRFKKLDIDKCFHALFECSAIGNLSGTSRNPKTTFKYKNKNAFFNSDEKLIIHNGLLKSLNIN